MPSFKMIIAYECLHQPEGFSPEGAASVLRVNSFFVPDFFGCLIQPGFHFRVSGVDGDRVRLTAFRGRSWGIMDMDDPALFVMDPSLVFHWSPIKRSPTNRTRGLVCACVPINNVIRGRVDVPSKGNYMDSCRI